MPALTLIRRPISLAVSVTGDQMGAIVAAAIGTAATDAAAAVAAAIEADRAAVEAVATTLEGVSVLFVPATSDNLYFPDTAAAHPVGAVAGKYYNNTNGTEGTLAYFGKTGIINLPDGTYTVDLSGAPAGVTFSTGQGVFRWTSGNVYISNGATGVTFSNGNRTAVVVSTGPFSLNIVASPTSTVMSSIWDDVMGALMVNEGSTAALYVAPVDPAEPLVPGPIFDVPTYSDNDDVRVYYDGVEFFYARTKWSATYDRVTRHRFGYAAEAGLNNGLWDCWGERLVPVAATMPQIVQAWNLAASAQILRSGVDEGAPININGVWLGGSHRPVVQQRTITAHGFVTGDIGALWNDGVRDRMLWAIVDANTTQWLALNTGTITAWNFSAAAFSGTTITHTSGGIATGSKTLSGSSTFPQSSASFIRNRVGKATIDGRTISAAGYYSGKKLAFQETYNIPNLARSAAYMIANNGASPTNVAIGSQIDVSQSISVDWTGATRIGWTPVDVEAYTPGQYGGAQAQTTYKPAGTTTNAIIPGLKPFTHSAVNYDFDAAAGQDITSLVASITFTKSLTWNDVAKPPYAIAYRNLASGTAQFGMLYVIDDTVGQGKTATRAGLTNGMLLTATFLKSYIIGGDSTSTSGADQPHEFVNCIVTFDPTVVTAFTWIAPYPKGGKTAYSVRAPGVVAARWLPVDPRLEGQPVTLSRNPSSSAALLSDVVGPRGVRVSTSGLTEFELTIG